MQKDGLGCGAYCSSLQYFDPDRVLAFRPEGCIILGYKICKHRPSMKFGVKVPDENVRWQRSLHVVTQALVPCANVEWSFAESSPPCPLSYYSLQTHKKALHWKV